MHVRTPSALTEEALKRIGELYAIDAGIRGMPAEQRPGKRQQKAKPRLKSLESWLRKKMKPLSRHSELAKVFTYALNQWPALTYYAEDGWAEADTARRRAEKVFVLPVSNALPQAPEDTPVQLGDTVYRAVCAGYVISLDGRTCLQLRNAAGQFTRLESDPLQIAQWLQACHDAGLSVRVQINESHKPDDGHS